MEEKGLQPALNVPEMPAVKKIVSKAEILKMAIDGLTGKDKEEFNKLIASTMEKRPVNNKIELQRG